MTNNYKKGENRLNELKLFNYDGIMPVRVIDQDGEPYFVLKDVCEVLEIERGTRIAERLDEDEVRLASVTDNLGREQQTYIINESGLYNVILRSDKPQAKQFKKWITAEVLPTIRKHGAYMTADTIEKTLTDPDYLIRLATTLKEERDKRIAAERQIEADKPKVEFFDQVADSKDAVDLGTAARVLNMGIGRNRLFEILRDNKILMENNQPYQKYIDAGYFRVVEQKYRKPDGTTCINIKTLVYQSGLNYIRKLLEKKSA
jgi:prophage antirepressor-like protein